MKAVLSLAVAIACCACAQAADSLRVSTRLVAVAPGFSSTSVNTAVFRNNSLVTDRDVQFIAFYGGDGYLVVGKRAVDSEEWTLCRSKYKGNVSDAHNVISLMVDGDGYVHVAFDHHNSRLRYSRGIAPHSVELGEEEQMTGDDEAKLTYPEFYRLADGGLLFVYRSGASGEGNLVMNRYDIKTHRWSRLHNVLIDGQGKRNAYWQLCVDRKGVIHLSWVWRESWLVETNHDLCYARSRDGGLTWEKSTGEQYTLPINADKAEYACRIPQNSELINQTGMTADGEGHPYIATYWRAEGDTVPQYRMVWNDGGRWRAAQLSHRTTPFSLSGGGTKMIPIARPRVLADGERVVCLFRDAERGSKVSMFVVDKQTSRQADRDKQTSDKAKSLVCSSLVNSFANSLSAETIDLTDFSVDAWEPTFDTELWTNRRRLHVYVQRTSQGDGERTVETKPQTVYVLEVSLDVDE